MSALARGFGRLRRPFLGAALHLGRSDVFHVLRQAPVVAEGVSDFAVSVAQELVHHGHVYLCAGTDGAKVDMPVMDQFWGDRYGKITDPFGHQWGLAQHVEDVAPEEMKRRADEWTAKMAKAAGQN